MVIMMKNKVMVLSQEKECIASTYVSDLDIREEFIYKESVEKYKNEEPCVIIRGKIANQVFCKLNEYIKGCKKEGRQIVPMEDLPVLFQEAILWDTKAAYIAIE